MRVAARPGLEMSFRSPISVTVNYRALGGRLGLSEPSKLAESLGQEMGQKAPWSPADPSRSRSPTKPKVTGVCGLDDVRGRLKVRTAAPLLGGQTALSVFGHFCAEVPKSLHIGAHPHAFLIAAICRDAPKPL